MALTNMDKRIPNLVSKRERTVERGRREEEKREEEEEEEKNKRRRGEAKPKRYGTTKFEYGSLVCRIIILPKPRVLLGFHHNPKIMESKVGKTLNSITRVWNPPFEVGFMV